LYDLIFGAKPRGTALSFRAHGAEGVGPVATLIDATVNDDDVFGRLKQPNGWKRGGARHRLVRETGQARIAGR
jgi:hypothetical protein